MMTASPHSGGGGQSKAQPGKKVAKSSDMSKAFQMQSKTPPTQPAHPPANPSNINLAQHEEQTAAELWAKQIEQHIAKEKSSPTIPKEDVQGALMLAEAQAAAIKLDQDNADRRVSVGLPPQPNPIKTNPRLAAALGKLAVGTPDYESGKKVEFLGLSGMTAGDVELTAAELEQVTPTPPHCSALLTPTHRTVVHC